MVCVVFSPSILDFSANFSQKADFQNFHRPNSRDQELQTVKRKALQSNHTYPTSTPNFGQTSNYNLLTTLSLFFAQEFAIGNTTMHMLIMLQKVRLLGRTFERFMSFIICYWILYYAWAIRCGPSSSIKVECFPDCVSSKDQGRRPRQPPCH